MNYKLAPGALAAVLGDDLATPGAQAYVRHLIAGALFDVLAGRPAPLILDASLGWWLDRDTLAVLLAQPSTAETNDEPPASD